MAALHHRRGSRSVLSAAIGHGPSSELACTGVPDPGSGAPPAVAPSCGRQLEQGIPKGIRMYLRRLGPPTAPLEPHLGVQCIVSTWAQSVPGPGFLDAPVPDHDCLTARICRLPSSTGDLVTVPVARSEVAQRWRPHSDRASAPAPAAAAAPATPTIDQ